MVSFSLARQGMFSALSLFRDGLPSPLQESRLPQPAATNRTRLDLGVMGGCVSLCDCCTWLHYRQSQLPFFFFFHAPVENGQLLFHDVTNCGRDARKGKPEVDAWSAA